MKTVDYHDQQPAIKISALNDVPTAGAILDSGSCTTPLRLPLLAVAIVSKTRYQRRRTRNQESQMNFDRNQQSRDRITIRCSRVPVAKAIAYQAQPVSALLVARLPRNEST